MTTELARLTDLNTPEVISDAMAVVQDPSTTPENKAAFYGVLVTIVRRINGALGTYVRSGPTAKSELTEHLVRNGGELGPLYLGWEAFDVSYPVNDAANWLDEQVQTDLQMLHDVSASRQFVRVVPAHLEIDVTALGSAVHEGSTAALAVWDFLKDKRYRIEGGKRPVLRVREVKAPKKGKQAA